MTESGLMQPESALVKALVERPRKRVAIRAVNICAERLPPGPVEHIARFLDAGWEETRVAARAEAARMRADAATREEAEDATRTEAEEATRKEAEAATRNAAEEATRKEADE